MIKGPKKTISILVPEELYWEVAALAKASSRSISAYIRQVLRVHLRYVEQFQKR